MRQVGRRGQGWLLAQLVGRRDLRDRQNFGPIGFEIGQRHGTIAGAEVNAETEARLHGRWCPDDSIEMAGRYFSSTSAGAMAGSRSAARRSNSGSFTVSVLQPRWTSTPENGAAPA